jgi:hypothetical protein
MNLINSIQVHFYVIFSFKDLPQLFFMLLTLINPE